MKTAATVNLILLATLISYLLISVKGEHLGGPLGLFLLFALGSKQLFYGIVPQAAVFLLITTMFVAKKRLFFAISMIVMYLLLIRSIDDLQLVSIIPFFILSIIAGALIWRYPDVSKK